MAYPTFGSDNFSGVHPEIMAAIIEANSGSAMPYGSDPWSQEAEHVARTTFGASGTALLALSGTGANILALSVMLRPWEGVVCATDSHLNTDETGAIEHALSAKLVTVPTPDGKLTPEFIEPHLNFSNEHHVVTRVVSISNLTELGTSYSPAETQALANFAHEHDMLLHVDGSRIVNAAEEQGVEISALSGQADVDALSLGATKNGAMGAEAVVFGERVDTTYARHARKQNLQLMSKSRFLGAQIVAMFQGDLWRRCATAANTAAREIERGLATLGIEPYYPRQGNELFVAVPQELTQDLEDTFSIHLWKREVSPGYDVVRIVTAFDKRCDDVEILLAWLRNRLDS